MNSFDLDTSARMNARRAAIAARPATTAERAIAADWQGRRNRTPLPRMSEIANEPAESGFALRVVAALVTAFLFGLALAHFAPNAAADMASRAAWEILPACPTEDSSNCKWDASTRGNGQGDSFIDVGGHVFRVVTE